MWWILWKHKGSCIDNRFSVIFAAYNTLESYCSFHSRWKTLETCQYFLNSGQWNWNRASAREGTCPFSNVPAGTGSQQEKNSKREKKWNKMWRRRNLATFLNWMAISVYRSWWNFTLKDFSSFSGSHLQPERIFVILLQFT